MAVAWDAVHRQIHTPSDGVLRDRGWLDDSLQDPAGFGAALFHRAASCGLGPCKSQHGIAYDFYHDAVLRHATGPSAARPALLWVDAGGALRALSYAQLHAASSLLVAAWRRRGVLPGRKICIVYPLGPEFALTVCTALRLGLQVSVLPPLGPDFLAARLAALMPSFLVTAQRYHSLLRPWYGARAPALADWLLAEPRLGPPDHATADGAAALLTEPREQSATSAVYAPQQPALALFSPLREPSHEPVELTASEAYLGLLRDGFLLGASVPGSVVAAPDHHLLQYQPTLLLLTLLHGGTYLHIGAADLASDSAAGARLPPISVLLLTAAVRDELLQRPPRALREVQSWLCPSGEASQPILWRDFVTRSQLDAVASACWLYDAACGGGLLFSLRQRGVPPQIVYPVPGRSFALEDPGAEGVKTRSGHGILRPLPGSIGVLLVEYAGGYVYGGTHRPTRSGRTMALREVEAIAGGLPFVAGAVAVPEPSDRGTATLLIFIGPHMKSATRAAIRALHEQVESHLRARLGAEFVPTDIQLVAAMPRLTERGIDHGWCVEQQRSGQLLRRAADPVLHLLDQLQFACHRAATPIGYMQLAARATRK